MTDDDIGEFSTAATKAAPAPARDAAAGYAVGASAMASMILLEDELVACWTLEELTDIFEHQLAAPLAVDLAECDLAYCVDASTPSQADDDCPGENSIQTFGDLFAHPRSPLRLLKLTKKFAKAVRQHPDMGVPGRVARFLYAASVLAARLRHGRRISSMSDAELARVARWLLAEPWVRGPVRQLLREGLTHLEKTRS